MVAMVVVSTVGSEVLDQLALLQSIGLFSLGRFGSCWGGGGGGLGVLMRVQGMVGCKESKGVVCGDVRRLL